MASLMRREPREEAADISGRFDKLFEEWARMLPFRPMAFPSGRVPLSLAACTRTASSVHTWPAATVILRPRIVILTKWPRG